MATDNQPQPAGTPRPAPSGRPAPTGRPSFGGGGGGRPGGFSGGRPGGFGGGRPGGFSGGRPGPGGRSGPGGRPSGRSQRQQQQRKKRTCRFCDSKETFIDYKNEKRLQRCVSEQGRIIPRRITGTCAPHQRQLVVAIKRARHIGLLPFVADAVS